MAAVLYALVFGVTLGLLSVDATTPWLKALGYVLTTWMFLAAILAGVRMSKDDD
jgi:predicted exporter